MPISITRRTAVKQIATVGGLLALPGISASAGAHATGTATGDYQFDFHYPLAELVGDLVEGERGDPHRESELPHHAWYTHETRHRWGAWGVPARRYAPLPELAKRPLAWRRERVLATAGRFIGYGYQHHHVPDWDPPANWPWKECCVGHNGKGVDCSNFTGFVYNQGFGIKFSSAIKTQAAATHALFGDESIPIHRIELPADYAERQQVLQTGDLLYIRGREEGPITHVILWVGSIGASQSGVPLILDSHGSGVDDDEGRPIPCGIHLRPFRQNSWYNRCASHAHRLFV